MSLVVVRPDEGSSETEPPVSAVEMAYRKCAVACRQLQSCSAFASHSRRPCTVATCRKSTHLSLAIALSQNYERFASAFSECAQALAIQFDGLDLVMDVQFFDDLRARMSSLACPSVCRTLCACHRCDDASCATEHRQVVAISRSGHVAGALDNGLQTGIVQTLFAHTTKTSDTYVFYFPSASDTDRCLGGIETLIRDFDAHRDEFRVLSPDFVRSTVDVDAGVPSDLEVRPLYGLDVACLMLRGVWQRHVLLVAPPSSSGEGTFACLVAQDSTVDAQPCYLFSPYRFRYASKKAFMASFEELNYLFFLYYLRVRAVYHDHPTFEDVREAGRLCEKRRTFVQNAMAHYDAGVRCAKEGLFRTAGAVDRQLRGPCTAASERSLVRMETQISRMPLTGLLFTNASDPAIGAMQAKKTVQMLEAATNAFLLLYKQAIKDVLLNLYGRSASRKRARDGGDASGMLSSSERQELLAELEKSASLA